MDEEVKVEREEEEVNEKGSEEGEGLVLVKVATKDTEEEEEEVEVVVDPFADIHALVRHYNSLYFDDALGSCVVKWSSCLTSYTGVCGYLSGGGCEICLSEPLLKFRKTSDIKNTLLHEMIHAFLWARENNRDHSEHGPSFQAIMIAINSNAVIDSQRPSSGYDITIYHDFHDDVDNYGVHQWICDSCGDCIKRSMNKKPSTGDCVEHKGKRKFCGNTSCHWHKHKMSCKGNYVKVAEPPGYKKKKMIIKDSEKVEEDKPQSLISITGDNTQRSQKPKGRKERTGDKMANPIVHLTPVMGENITNTLSHFGDVSWINVNCKEMHSLKTEILCPSMTPHIPKRARTSRPWKTSLPTCTKRKRSDEYTNEFSVISKWLNYYETEGMHEDVKPLINKRTERRKKMKLMKIQLERSSMRENMDKTLDANMTSCSGSFHTTYDGSTSSAHATDTSRFSHMQNEAMDCTSHAHTRGPNKCTSPTERTKAAQSLPVSEIAKQELIQYSAKQLLDTSVENVDHTLHLPCNSGCSTSMEGQVGALKAIWYENSSAMDDIIDLSD